MTDLSKHTELTDITFDHEGAHLAVCHVSQGYSANGRPDALLFKSAEPITKSALASLKDVYSDETIIKMTADNKRRYLEALITAKLKETLPDEDYIYIYVMDYNEDMVSFNFSDETWAVSYTVQDGDAETITLGDNPRKVFRADIYIEVETGEALIKAAVFNELPDTGVSSEDGDVKQGDLKDSPTQKGNDEMSDTKIEVGELLKSAEAQEMLKAMATDLAKAQFEELQKAAKQEKLVQDTTEVVKGLSSIGEDSVEGIVKCLVEIDQGVAGDLLKAMGDMQEAVVKAQEEAEAIKKEFGEKQDTKEVSVEKTVDSDDRAAQLAAVVNKMKNK